MVSFKFEKHGWGRFSMDGNVFLGQFACRARTYEYVEDLITLACPANRKVTGSALTLCV